MSDMDPVMKNRSFLNPMDLASMQNEEMFTPDMTVMEAITKALTSQGIDPNGPVTQLGELAQKNVQNADMVGKMQNIAADSGVETPAPTPGLEGLLGG